jgi:5'(3')-deoxyribonucleotidase
MNRIFVDMDGPVVDFDRFRVERGLTGDQVKRLPGAYLEMQPTVGGLEAVRSLIGMGFEVWFATKPPTGVAFAYGDKAQWVFDRIPELKRRLILTHDKGLLGDKDDFLIDDRVHKANCLSFPGKIMHYREGYAWPEILQYFRERVARMERCPKTNSSAV